MSSNAPSTGLGDALIAQAIRLGEDVDSFHRHWPPMPVGQTTPAFTWEELERQLVDLAPSDLQAELAHSLLLRVRRLAGLKPPEMVLREILRVAALVLEPSQDVVTER